MTALISIIINFSYFELIIKTIKLTHYLFSTKPVSVIMHKFRKTHKHSNYNIQSNLLHWKENSNNHLVPQLPADISLSEWKVKYSL